MSIVNVEMGQNVVIWHPELVNLYGCKIGDNCRIGAFVEIGVGVLIGDRCKIEAYAFIPPGVVLEDGVFVGPHACFTNDKTPRAIDNFGRPHTNWDLQGTLVKKGASVGANATILPGIIIGEGAMIGAGSVVVKNVPAGVIAYGNPARWNGERV